MLKLGIDVGSSAVRIVAMEDGKAAFVWQEVHHGRYIDSLLRGLSSLPGENVYSAAITGTGISAKDISVTKIDDIPAMTEGCRFLCPGAKSIIGIGSQDSCYITDLDKKAPSFSTNEHCAGGTGSFFEDQMQRLGLSIEDYSSITRQAVSIPRLSGRCSVFAKTDIIHRQQEGVPTPDILLGLCYAMIRNYKAIIIRTLPVNKPVVFCGGVTKNEGVIRAIKEVLNLSDEELLIPELACYAPAIGAAIKSEGCFTPDELKNIFCKLTLSIKSGSAEPLSLPENISLIDPPRTEKIPEGGVSLGIDIGSTSTDLVMLGADGELIDYWYLRTAGDPEKAVRFGLSEICKKYGKISFRSVGVTGSGRERIGRMIGADAVRDEITAQAKGASFRVPSADTVFEIGGQDSKYISLTDGKVSDFAMNKICAAGTGSFVEEQASRMGIPIGDFGRMALDSKSPAVLGERCTVFIETAISSAVSEGVPTCDIAAGLCLSIVSNYLHKVVGTRKVGEHIVLQGGVAYNPGIVAAFRQFYGDRITVNPCFSISGAFGAALLAEESMMNDSAPDTVSPADSSDNESINKNVCDRKTSSFKGFDFDSDDTVSNTPSEEIKNNIAFYKKAGELLLDGYTGKIDPNKKTVGVPYVLMIHKFFPMANAYFTSLGYNVLLTKPTDEDTIALSQQLAQSETCYPVKLIYGHMQQLIDAGVDYIFLPTIHTMKHALSGVAHNYGCVYMQTAPVSVAKAMKLEEKGITLLSPVFDLDFGKQAMAESMIGLGKILGKPMPLCAKALIGGSMAVNKHTNAVEELGQQILSKIKPDDKVLVLITRNYGVSDPVLNMGIPAILLERGYKVITLSHLPAHALDISDDYPNLYWPFGQHIISGAKIIAHHPNLYAVYLTNHGCGPDSMLSHMFGQVMGDKPYLQIEVDEHFSKVGVITRIEAFLNSISGRKAEALPEDFNLKAVEKCVNVPHLSPLSGRTVRIPDYGVYTAFLQQFINSQGLKAEIMPRVTSDAIALGRSRTSSKEYLPFAALIGQVMADIADIRKSSDATKDNQAESTADGFKTDLAKVQYLIPSTRGTEADGLYAQAVCSELDDAAIYAPILETLPELKDFDLLCRSIATGDLCTAIACIYGKTLAKANTDTNVKTTDINTLVDETGIEIPDKILTWDELNELAAKIGQVPVRGRKIAAVGSPIMMNVLDSGVLEKLGSEGDTVLYAPLIEYLCMLWEEQDEAKSHKGALGSLRLHMKQLGEAMGERNPFAGDFDALTATAEAGFPRFNGGGGRYRYAKVLDMGQYCSAVLHVYPRYENTGMVLELRGLSAKCKAPVYQLQLDADWDESAESRLRSFLYYC